ncbi:hypothetical protein ACX1C1_20385 [Paenibacillus sp. strain BS8-2]
MIMFEQKVEELKRVEAMVYTNCLTLTDNEAAAYTTAERALLSLFQDNEYWLLSEGMKRQHILKVCSFFCMQHAQVSNHCIHSVV